MGLHALCTFMCAFVRLSECACGGDGGGGGCGGGCPPPQEQMAELRIPLPQLDMSELLDQVQQKVQAAEGI